jgi:hypothetical protein
MKAAIIRVDKPAPTPPHGAYFVRSAGRDGSFALTRDKSKARRFTLARAAEKIAAFANTRMQFSICDAPQ